MRTTHLAALVAALALAACSSASRPQPEISAQPATDRSDGSAGTTGRADSARHRYTRADVDFMSHMIDHHAQALVMSGWAPTHDAGPAIQRLAERIINGQQDEIASMQRWLRNRGQPVPEPEAAPKPMPMQADGHHHQHLMPGMLSQAQMKELDQARGAEFDRLFLTYMIQHHQGAVTMVNDLFGTPGAARDESVFKLASDISADQSSEITRMEQMLAALPQGAPAQ
jgi:uncharacterized protein (DUF305 family)